jgi:hypothetical protein
MALFLVRVVFAFMLRRGPARDDAGSRQSKAERETTIGHGDDADRAGRRFEAIRWAARTSLHRVAGNPILFSEFAPALMVID